MRDATVGRVITSYRDRVAAVRQRVITYVERTWRGLPDYRDAGIDRFVAAVVPVVAGGQRQVATLTDAYLAQIEAATLGVGARPVGVPPAAITSEALRGVAAADVYQRAGLTVWTALADGDAFGDAVGKGLVRARSLATTDLQLAKTHTSRLILDAKPNVERYRRVLEGGKPCALCVVAATAHTYATGDLMPIHANCDCGVEPIFESRDPGRPDVTEEVDLSEDDVVVHDHGELGPVLAVRGQEFTGPDDI